MPMGRAATMTKARGGRPPHWVERSRSRRRCEAAISSPKAVAIIGDQHRRPWVSRVAERGDHHGNRHSDGADRDNRMLVAHPSILIG
jgi:hypothetical protein